MWTFSNAYSSQLYSPSSRQNAITPIVFRYVQSLTFSSDTSKNVKLAKRFVTALQATTGAKAQDRFSTSVSIGCQERPVPNIFMMPFERSLHSLIQEALKLMMSFALAILEFGGSFRAALTALSAVEWGDSLRLAVPALLFVLQNAVKFLEDQNDPWKTRKALKAFQLFQYSDLFCNTGLGHAACNCSFASGSFSSHVARENVAWKNLRK